MKEILKNGLLVEHLRMNISIFIHCLIADAPARAKITRTKQFNGEFGCMHCLNPGLRIGRRLVYVGTNHETKTTVMPHFWYHGT